MMIPNVFICSTIESLHYLRDAIREAVEELSYHPVMSEHGEVGYIRAATAATSCFRTISQCQLAVVIVGKIYHPNPSTGLSVTHGELRAARENGIPVITFVENDVRLYKQFYDVNRGNA